MLNTTISFNYKKKKYSWTFDHNLDEFGLSIDAAFINYTARLAEWQKPLQAAFCEYVISKDRVNLKCSIFGETSHVTMKHSKFLKTKKERWH